MMGGVKLNGPAAVVPVDQCARAMQAAWFNAVTWNLITRATSSLMVLWKHMIGEGDHAVVNFAHMKIDSLERV